MVSEQRTHEVLGYEFGSRQFTPPAQYKLRLSLKRMTNETDYSELSSSIGYAPIDVPNDTNNWSSPANRTVTNLNQLTFPIFTDSLADTNKVKSWFLTSDLTPGAPAIYWGDFEEERPVLKDSLIWINPGELKIQRENPI